MHSANANHAEITLNDQFLDSITHLFGLTSSWSFNFVTTVLIDFIVEERQEEEEEEEDIDMEM
jgi:hypothetical protein